MAYALKEKRYDIFYKLLKKRCNMLRDSFLYAESWNVAFRKSHSGDIFKDKKSQFTVIKNNFRYWAADPFIVETSEEVYIFAELFDYVLRRGVLGYCTLKNGKVSKWKPILKEDYHLSYPCIFERNGKVYMMPESGAGNVLTIYESIKLPDLWRKKEVVKDGVKYADTTPLPHSKKNIALTHDVVDAQNPKLKLIDIFDDSNEKIISTKSAFRSRPAGNVFELDGKLIRPAQISLDTSKGYGKALVFYEYNIDENDLYNESEVKELYPKSLAFNKSVLLDGMHTYNSSDNYEVIDIKTRRFNILDFFMRIMGKLFHRKG